MFGQKNKEVKPSKTLNQALLDARKNPLPEAKSILVDEIEAKAQEVFKLLGGKYNINYDVAESKQNPGTYRASISLNCYDKDHFTINDKGERQSIGQTVSMTYADKDIFKKDEAGKETNEILIPKGMFSYVNVSTYNAQKNTADKVAVSEEYDSVTKVREVLEKGGFLRPYVTLEGFDKNASAKTPNQKVYNNAFKAVSAINEKIGKTEREVKVYDEAGQPVLNDDGTPKTEKKATNEFYMGKMVDSSFVTQDGQTVAQETFNINNHSKQFMEVKVQEGKVVGVAFADATNYNKDSKMGIVKANAFTNEYVGTIKDKCEKDKSNTFDMRFFDIYTELAKSIEWRDREATKGLGDAGKGDEGNAGGTAFTQEEVENPDFDMDMSM
jgi:hypothetical protein